MKILVISLSLNDKAILKQHKLFFTLLTKASIKKELLDMLQATLLWYSNKSNV